jgi:hypothetical protein
MQRQMQNSSLGQEMDRYSQTRLNPESRPSPILDQKRRSSSMSQPKNKSQSEHQKRHQEIETNWRPTRTKKLFHPRKLVRKFPGRNHNQRIGKKKSLLTLSKRRTSQQPEPSPRTDQQQSTNLLQQQLETKTKVGTAAAGQGKKKKQGERREKQKQKSTHRGTLVYLSRRRGASKQRALVLNPAKPI